MTRLLFSILAFSLFATVATAQFDGLVINEIVASNDSIGGYQEPDGGYGDWVELYNNSNSALNLEGVNFSDDLTELDKWTFPAGVTIAAGGYLIVWTDDDIDQAGVHTNFKLSKGGEDLALSNGGTIIDQHTFGEQETNIAEARNPNGTGNFVMQATTPNGNNEVLGTREPSTVRLSAFPNPAANVLNVTFGTDRFDRYEVVSLTGAIVMKDALNAGDSELLLDVSALAAGQYQVVLDGGKAAASFTRQ
ncbi:MAG: lamin tail domain-containing protein [Saprospiraceae bacterium]